MTILSSPSEDELLNLLPDKMVGVREIFGVDSDMQVPAFSVRDSHVPDFDDAYQFAYGNYAPAYGISLVLALLAILVLVTMLLIRPKEATL